MVRKLIALVFLCTWCHVTPAHACELSYQSSWFATEAELVAGTAEIFIGRVVNQRPEAGDQRGFHLEYEMQVLDRIKGSPPDRLWIGSFGPVTPVGGSLGRGRVSYGADCKMLAPFEQGQRYLVFRGSFHPKGYERVATGEDAWLETVRRFLRTAASGERAAVLCSDVVSSPRTATQGRTPDPARPNPPRASAPINIDGLELTVAPTRATFASRDALEMTVTFRNRRSTAMRTPDGVQPPNVLLWVVTLEDVRKDRVCTGASTLAQGQLRAGAITPVVLQPGEARSATVSFSGFGYADGQMSREAAINVLRRQEQDRRMRAAKSPDAVPPDKVDVGAEVTIAPGTYRLSVTVEFPAFPTYRGVPDDVRDEIARLAADPVPMWAGGTIRSSPVEITITP